MFVTYHDRITRSLVFDQCLSNRGAYLRFDRQGVRAEFLAIRRLVNHWPFLP